MHVHPDSYIIKTDFALSHTLKNYLYHNIHFFFNGMKVHIWTVEEVVEAGTIKHLKDIWTDAWKEIV